MIGVTAYELPTRVDDHIIIIAGFPWTKQSEAQMEKLPAWVITTGESCLQPCFPVLSNTALSYGLASWTIELSEPYIKKLNCGHTLQSHDAVVLKGNNSTGMPSVTAASIYSDNIL